MRWAFVGGLPFSDYGFFCYCADVPAPGFLFGDSPLPKLGNVASDFFGREEGENCGEGAEKVVRFSVFWLPEGYAVDVFLCCHRFFFRKGSNFFRQKGLLYPL
jgi:hypothetical protein